MAGRPLWDAGVADGELDRLLDEGFIHMVTPLLSRGWIDPPVLLREDPLPDPVGGSIRILPGERVGQEPDRDLMTGRMVLGATHDPQRSPALAKSIAQQIRGARYVEVESGHFMAAETPDLFARHVVPFLRGRVPPT